MTDAALFRSTQPRSSREVGVHRRRVEVDDACGRCEGPEVAQRIARRGSRDVVRAVHESARHAAQGRERGADAAQALLVSEVVARVDRRGRADAIGELGDPRCLRCCHGAMCASERWSTVSEGEPAGRSASSCRRTVNRNRSMHVPQTAAERPPPRRRDGGEGGARGVTDGRRSSSPGTAP
jgi:hypothetical protein